MKGCLTYIYICLALSSITFLVTGCATASKSELLEIHDTITANRVDTVRQHVRETVHDTIHNYTEHIVTVNEKGDTTKETNNNYFYQHTIERDSSSQYIHLIDSLIKSLNQNHDKEEVKEKKTSWWNTLPWMIIAIGAIIALVIVLIYITFPNLRRKTS